MTYILQVEDTWYEVENLRVLDTLPQVNILLFLYIKHIKGIKYKIQKIISRCLEMRVSIICENLSALESSDC